MSVDIASLVFEVDARPVEAAAEKLDRLVAAADRADKAQKNLSSGSAEGARSATAFAESMGAIERATLSATTGATAFARAQREMLAEQRGIAQATAAYNRLRAELDPLEAIEAKLAQRTATLNTAFEKGAIDVDEYNTMLTRVTKAAADGVDVHGRYAGSAKLTSNQLQNLSYQLNDVVTGLVSGQKPMQIMAQQGGQIFQAFQMGPGGVGGSLKAVAELATTFGPLVAVLGAITATGVGAVMMFRDQNTVTAETTTEIKNLTTATNTYTRIAGEAEGASGRLRQMLEHDANAARQNAEEKRKLAEANLTAARSAVALALAQVSADKSRLNPGYVSVGQGMGGGGFGNPGAVQMVDEAALNKAKAAQKAYEDGLHEVDKALLKMQADAEKGGQSMLASLREQNAEFGKSRGQIILMKAEAEAAKPQNAGLAASLLAAARSAAAHADAEDHRKAALKGSTEATRNAAEVQNAIAKEAAERLKKDFADYDNLTRAVASPAEQAAMKVNEQFEIADRLLNDNILSADQYYELVYKLGAKPIPKFEFDTRGFKEFNDEAVNGAKAITDAEAKAAEAAAGVGHQMDQVFRDIKNHDWAGAFSGLMKAIKSVKDSWASMTTADRISAVSNIAGSVGGAVGGSAGAALSGAAGGAIAGASLFTMVPALATLGPVGLIAGVGAALGGALGLFGDSKAKKAQKAQEQAQAAAEAAQHAQDVLTQSRQIEIQRLTLSGDALGALNAQRALEMQGIDATNQAAMQANYDLEDALALRQKEIELMQAQGDAAGALAAQRELELQSMVPAIAAIQKQINAAQDAQAAAQAAADAAAKAKQEHDAQVADLTSQLTTAYNDQTSAIGSAIDKLTSFRDSVLDFERSLNTSDLNGAGLAASYRAAAADFYATGPLAKANDPAAQARIVQVEQTFLAASKASASDQLFYLRDLAAVKALDAELVTTANDQIDTATAQLNGINATVAGLIDVKGAVNAVNGSVVDLANSLRALMAGTKAANDNGSSGGGASNDPFQGQTGSMLTEYFRQQAAGETYEQTLLNRKSTVLDLYNSGMAYTDAINFAVANHLPGYASGGNHPGGARLVGEYGPEIEVTGPSRIWNAAQTAQMLGGDNSDVVEAIGALTDTVGEQQQTMKDMARDLAQLRRDFTNVTRGGEAMQTKDAA